MPIWLLKSYLKPITPPTKLFLKRSDSSSTVCCSTVPKPFSNLLLVDMVVIFEEDTPLELISSLLPDVLVKGGDYTIETIVGAKEVIANGGKVIINPIIEGFSTTNTIEKIKNS